jgi:cytochrome P450
VRAGLADPRLSLDKTNSRRGYTGFTLPPALDANLLNLDPPDHNRLRRLVTSVFTARRTSQLRPAVERHISNLLDNVDPGTATDMVAALCAPLPLAVISDLLGLDQLDQMRAWTDALIAPGPHQAHTPRQAIAGIETYIRDLIKHRRQHPDDNLTSGLIAARDGKDQLTDDELTSLVFLLIWAGYETSIDALSTAVLTLLVQPGLADGLRQQPADIPAAVEEMLRLHGPTPMAIRRFATEDILISDVTIPAGDTVLLLIAAANRDPATFAQPDTPNLDRNPNAHLAFGFGIHHCLGAPLARLQLVSVVRALVQRYPTMTLAIPQKDLAWRSSFRARGLTALPVLLHPE